MKKLSLLFLLLVSAAGAQARSDITKSLECNVLEQGKVAIHQDLHIAALLGNVPPSIGKWKILKPSGYRVQTYTGNNIRQVKNEAHNVGSRVKEYFPKPLVHTPLNSPRWLCRVGDLRSIKEADTMMHKLKAAGVFKEVSIVKDQINTPL